MLKALLKVLVYYTVGYGLYYFAYKFVPYTYIHGPGIHHILILIMFIGSFIWGVVSFVNWRSSKSNKYEKWTAIFHLIPVLVFVIWFIVEVMSYP